MKELRSRIDISTAVRKEKKDCYDLIDEEKETGRNNEEMIKQKLEVTIDYNSAMRNERESMKKNRKGHY